MCPQIVNWIWGFLVTQKTKSVLLSNSEPVRSGEIHDSVLNWASFILTLFKVCMITILLLIY